MDLIVFIMTIASAAGAGYIVGHDIGKSTTITDDSPAQLLIEVGCTKGLIQCVQVMLGDREHFDCSE
jgi:hypothetical protein